MNSIIEVDNGSREECSKLQVFIKTPTGKYPDAITLLDPVYDPYKESLFWAKGYSRIFVDLPSVTNNVNDDGDTPLVTQVSTYKNAFYTFMIQTDTFMFTNNKARREFYMYYSGTETQKREHDFNFCDSGYNCFEIDYSHMSQTDYDELIKGLAAFLAIVVSSEPLSATSSEFAMCTGGEFKTISYKNQIKFKTMPQFDLSHEFFDKMFDPEFISLLRASKKNKN
jgi:hypothetical protein